MPAGVDLSGYLKELDFARRDDGVWRGLSAKRFRLDGSWHNAAESVDAKLISDHEYLQGSLINSFRNSLGGNTREDELLQMQWVLNEKENLIWRHILYRAWAHAKVGDWDVAAGRQRMAWGTGRLWNPTDVINPYDPMSVEREERAGSDAAQLKWSPTGLSYLEAVYVPKRGADWRKSLVLGKARMNYLETDWSAMGGKIGDERMIGADFASQALDGSFRGEVTYTFDSPVRRDFARTVLSYDYNFSFSRPLYVVGEYFYNGIGELGGADYFKVVLRANDQKFLGRDYAGLGATWDITPLLKLDCYTIVNLNDSSAFFGPRLKYQVLTDVEIGVGAQIFEGKSKSEYGATENIGFALAQWYFSSR